MWLNSGQWPKQLQGGRLPNMEHTPSSQYNDPYFALIWAKFYCLKPLRSGESLSQTACNPFHVKYNLLHGFKVMFLTWEWVFSPEVLRQHPETFLVVIAGKKGDVSGQRLGRLLNIQNSRTTPATKNYPGQRSPLFWAVWCTRRSTLPCPKPT